VVCVSRHTFATSLHHVHALARCLRLGWPTAPLKDIEEAKQTALDEELERFMEHAVGIRSNSPNFLKSSMRSL
jgi:hypothetical protein